MLGKTLILSLAFATGMSEAVRAHSPSDPAASATITRLTNAHFGGPFSLTDQNGRPVSSADFRGTPMLIYFGYTNCPDACPLDAQAISNVVDVLDRRGRTVVPIFITVDPERDTLARLKEFLSAFHPRFVGLTGPLETVTRIATAYGASGEGDRVNVKSDKRYDVLHAAVAFLMGRHGEFLDIIHLDDDPAIIADRINKLVGASDGPRNVDLGATGRTTIGPVAPGPPEASRFPPCKPERSANPQGELREPDRQGEIPR